MMFGLGVFIIVASGMGIFKTHGVIGEFFGTLIAGIIIVAMTTVAFRGSR